jgi:hypothetical protein
MGHPGQTQKDQGADDPLRANIDPPAKETKTEGEFERKAWESWEYPPEFYDRLSTVSLNRRALKELDRRTRIRRSHPSPPPVDTNVDTILFTDMAHFARHGGPDLRDLRGVSRHRYSVDDLVLTHAPSIPNRQAIFHLQSP